MIINTHKRVMQKLKDLRKCITETNAGVTLIVKEYMQAEIYGDELKQSGLKNDF